MRRPRILRLGAAVAVAIGVAVVARVATSSTDPRSVRVPERGEVAATFVEGQPVFVVHTEDGEVLVLDAVSPHVPEEGPGKALASCRTSAWFEDLWHGSSFTTRGTWVGGPSPTGMARYEARQEGDRVVVGARLPAPDRDEGERTEPAGPTCGSRTAVSLPGHEPDPEVLADLVVHEPAGGEVAELWYPTPAVVLGEQDPGR